MKRLLCITGSMGPGGAEGFIMKLYRCIDRTKFQIDFCVGVSYEAFYDNEIKSLGGRIFHITPKSKSLIQMMRDIYRICQENTYDSVLRMASNAVDVLELIPAKKAGIKRIVMRSAIASCIGMPQKIVHSIFVPFTRVVPNVRIAPSTEAAEFMFGKKCIKQGKATLLHNPVDTKLFKFDEKSRERIRSELNIQKNTFVIGNVSRFYEQKNHSFLIEIFRKIHEYNKNTILILVGDGEKKVEIEALVKKHCIEESVKLLGECKNVYELMSSFDIFVLPSLFEGMPNVVIEAQSNGLRCVVSNTITHEVDITGRVSFASLTNVDDWAKIIKLDMLDTARPDMTNVFAEKKYNVEGVRDDFLIKMFGI